MLEIGKTSLPENFFARFRKIVAHSHFDRQNKGTALCEQKLRDWIRAFHIDAVGIGSPWTSDTSADYRRCETVDRDRYYANPVPDPALLRKDEIYDLTERLTRNCGALCFLDNETPKGRNGHLWYFNFQYKVPAWHDYSQDRPVRYYWNDPHIEQNALTGEPHTRRPYYDVVMEQRRAGAMAVWAHPTSWWTGPNNEFVTNIAAELPAHLVLDGFADGMTVSGYDAMHRGYRALYFRLLDRGYRIPAFAEMDFSSIHLKNEEPIANYFEQEDKPHDAREIADAARTGNHFIGSGIRIAMEIDGSPMGSTLTAERGRTRHMRIYLEPCNDERECSRLEITGLGGKNELSLYPAGPGIYDIEFTDSGEYAYYSACAYGEHDNFRARQQEIRVFAMTNPIWIAPDGYRFPQPGIMQCSFAFRPDSPFHGGSFRIPGLGSFPASDRTLEIPANTAVELISADEKRTFRSYPFFEDARVQRLISHLSEGGFRTLHPELCPGEVPADCFDPEQWTACLPDVHAKY